jgi:hypothetical protein
MRRLVKQIIAWRNTALPLCFIHLKKSTYMQHKTFLSVLAAFLLFVPTMALTIGGVDSYEIYLNNKLITRQVVTQPLSLQHLELTAANSNDELVVRYSHCGKIGTARKIAIKDASGKIVKEWKFANATGSDKGMTIPVKEVLQLQQLFAKTALSLYYISDELPAGRLLTGVQFTGKGNS